MRGTSRHLALIGLLLTTLMAQTPVRQLLTDARVSVRNQKAMLLRAPFECDERESVYFVPFNSRSIQRVSRDGQNVLNYFLPPVSDTTNLMISDFSVGNDGTLYVLALESEPIAKKPKPLPNTPDSIPKGHVVRLDTDGTRSSDVLLDLPGYIPGALAATETSFITSGNLINLDTQRGESSVVVFDRNGHFLRNLTGVTDKQPAVPVEALMSKMLVGSDGNIYTKLPSGTTTQLNVAVISPSGSLVRRFSIAAPQGKWYFDSMRESYGRLAILYHQKSKLPDGTSTLLFRIQIVQSDNGEEVSQYDASNLGIALACYERDAFTFLSIGPEQELQLVRAIAK